MYTWCASCEYKFILNYNTDECNRTLDPTWLLPVHSQLSSNICWCSCVVSWSCSSMLSLQVLPWASWVPCAFRWWSENWYNSSVNVLWSYGRHFKSTIFHKTFPPAIESELPFLSKMSLYVIRASTRVLIPRKNCVQSSCLLLKRMTEASKLLLLGRVIREATLKMRIVSLKCHPYNYTCLELQHSELHKDYDTTINPKTTSIDRICC